nr:hypothetical protein [Photorhabdus aegyptia]
MRESEWTEFDFDKDIWQIPAGRIKIRHPHIIPRSNQVKTILIKLHKRRKYVFPGHNDAGKPMSETAINQVIKRIGYDDS